MIITIYFMFGIILLLIGTIMSQQNVAAKSELMHKLEREGLYNRIMAKDLNEYAMAQSPQQKRSAGGNMIKDVEDLKNKGFIK